MMQPLVEGLKQFEEDTSWLYEHYDRLKLEYPDQFIAVFQQQVVDHDPDLSRLMERLRERYQEEAGRIAVEYISRKKMEYVL